MGYYPSGMPSNVYDNHYKDKEKNKSSSSSSSSGNKGTPYSPPNNSHSSSSNHGTPYSPPNNSHSTSSSSSSFSFNNYPTLGESAQSISHSYDSTSHTTSIPTSVPTSVRNKAEQQQWRQNWDKEHSTSYSNEDAVKQQQYTNESYINSLLGTDATKVLNNTNTAQVLSGTKVFRDIQKFNAERIYEVLPTVDRERIINNVLDMKRDDKKYGTNKYAISNNRLMKEVYKLIQTKSAEYEQHTLQEMQETGFWEANQCQYVTYATASDYYNMQRNGAATVYIEDGTGKLDNKGGVYTIGRDRLAGVPKDVHTVLVDKNGNWRYIANSGSRASYVEDIRNRQYALTSMYEHDLQRATTAEKFTKYKCEQLEKYVTYLDKVANKSRKQEDFDRLQSAIEEWNSYAQYNNAAKSKIAQICSEWSDRYTIFENAARKYTKWTVEDEERLRALEKAISRSNNLTVNSTNVHGIADSKVAERYGAQLANNKLQNDLTMLSEYNALKKRKQEEGYLPVFMDLDSVEKMKKDEESMKKIVDEYNIWDSAIIHTDKGEDFGTYAKRLIFRDIIDPATDEEKRANANAMTEQVNWGNTFGNYKLEYFKEDIGGMVDSVIKLVSPFMAAHKDKNRAQAAYKAAEDAINSGKLSSDEEAELRVKQQEYLDAQNNAYKQARSVFLNNVMANMSILDLASVQSTFVAWRMAKHPERYANDPKFKKMQAAYKAVYGTDYRGAMDAGNMMHAMLNVKLGKLEGGAANDYIYLDGSDLRHENGEQYGFWASLGVGIGTDISAVVGLAKTATTAVVKSGGTKMLAKATADSVLQSLTRAGVTQEVAEEFVKSDIFQKALRKDLKGAISKYMREGGTELGSDIRNILKNRADDFKYMFESTTPGAFKETNVRVFKIRDNSEVLKGITHNIDEARYAKFLDDAERVFANTADMAERSLLINRGTVIANTLGSVDNLLDDVQTKLFKLSCPVAGAVTAVARGTKWIKSLKNLRLADAVHLTEEAVTQSQLASKVAKLDWNSCLDTVGFKKLHESILEEFSWGALGDIKRRIAMGNEAFDKTVELFSQYKDGIMHNVASSYIDNVISKLRTTLNHSDNGIQALEELAQQNNFNTFSDMYKVIKENLTQLTEHNPESFGIIEAFDSLYDTAFARQQMKDISSYVKYANDHLYSINHVLGGDISVMTFRNSLDNPGFVEGIARTISDNIHDFMYTANPDMMLFTNAAGELSTVHEIASKAIQELDSIALGNTTTLDIAAAVDSLKEYADEIQNVYIKNLDDWSANTMKAVLGDKNYLNEIERIVPNHAGNDELLKVVNDNIMEYFKNKGIHVTQDDIDKVLKQNTKDFEKMSMTERQSVIYRITENKGTNAIGQIYDENLKVLTDALTDCNSQLNKNIKMMQLNVNEAASKRISDAIANACAIENTRVISDAMHLDGVDSTMHMAVMDVISGNAYTINRLVQNYPPDIAASKIRDFIMDESRKQLALHNGTYRMYRELGCDTVDVESNVYNIAKQAENIIPSEENCIDIYVSMVKSTDTAAPKDISFMRKGADKASTFRKNSEFAVYDDGFAKRTYGRTASQLTEDYAALEAKGTLSGSDWKRSIQAYINEQKQIALAENKTLRFIGFNSSDAISGGNKYINDVLRSCGVNANTANAVDLADCLRKAAGEYVFNPADIEAMTKGIRSAIDSARSRSVSLDILPTIAYDPKYICTDMLKGALDKTKFADSALEGHAKYILDELETTIKGLGTGAYNKSGLVMGAYLDATAFAQILEDAGQSVISANGDLMKIISESTLRGDAQLSMHKVIETAMDNEWVDYSNINEAWFSNFAMREKVHSSVLQINNIHSNLHRLDLITDDDLEGLRYIYAELTESIPYTSHEYLMTKLFRTEELTAQQLYCVDKWLMDNAKRLMDNVKYDDMYSKMLFNAQKQASYLSDVGYRFIKNNIVDYTDDTLDAFLVKWLDTSEEGYRFASALNDLADLEKKSQNLKNYQDAVEGIFRDNNIHGVQDRLLVMQMADVHRPIMEFQDDIKKVYEKAWGTAMQELAEEAPYSREMMQKVATERGVNAAKQYIIEQGEKARMLGVQQVTELNEEALKTHLIRNCCGGMIIDPNAKCVQGIDLPLLFERWKSYNIKIDEIDFSNDLIANRRLFRISLPELDNANMDEIFEKYNHARVKFDNEILNKFDSGMRDASFGASDLTLMNGQHVDAFRELFFKDSGTILNLNQNFNSWADELYSCNMWTDMDLKQLVNPYYTDNMLNNLAQNTHQLRNNISAVHDLGSIVNNRYMNTKYILQASGTLSDIPIWEQRDKIVKQITDQKQHLCRITVNKHNKLTVVDYTPRLAKKSTSNELFESILENTVMLDEGMVNTLMDWSKSTSIALKLQASNAPEWFTNTYQLYKKTIRNGIVSAYLYLNLGTAVRNAVDSSTKGLAETLQYDQDVATYLRKYKDAVQDTLEYANISREIEEEFGTVNRETIAKYFANDVNGLNKFNILYGYEHTCGESLTDMTLKETRQQSVKYLMEGTDLTQEMAEDVRKVFDRQYCAIKYYGMTNAQIAAHKVEIHDACMKRLHSKYLDSAFTEEQWKTISDKFWDYHPTVASWGDQISRFPILSFNKARFNNAEVRARLAVYETFLEGGATEFEAMKHVNATQFHYAGIGKVEDFMPFTQYKLYNALYWFDHANAHAISTAWRAAQYNDDGSMTNQEIAAMIAKYNQKKYYLYDEGADADYDEYYQNNLNVLGHILLDGVDSYLGVPRTFSAGNLDLNGTHYLKLGNSFVEEVDLVTSLAVGMTALTTTMRAHVTDPTNAADKIRSAYESLKYTPLYDSFYSPWKSYIDLIAFAYDNKKITEAKRRALETKSGIPSDVLDKMFTSKDIWDNYADYVANKSTHSEAISALSIVGAVLANAVGRWKSFDLNLGEIAALIVDPDAKNELFSYVSDLLIDTAGMLIPSVVGTKIEPVKSNINTYAASLSKNYLVANPTTYFDIMGRLQRELGFDEDEARQVWNAMQTGWELGDYKSKLDYYHIAKDLHSRGFTDTEIINLFKQNGIPKVDNKRFLAMTNALPNYLRYDKNLRNEVLSYYKALGYSTDAAWAKLMSNPAIIRDGKLIELTNFASAVLSKRHDELYWALHNTEPWTDSEWKAYWDTLRELGHYYPKGKWKETRDYLVRMGYTYNEARDMLLHGYMLDDNGRLVDTPGAYRRYAYSFNRLSDAEFQAYWATLPDYTKYEKGAFGRTIKALKKMGYDDATARALIQQGIYVDKNGNMLNVTGMQRPVLGYANFNAYYNTIPEYCRYEKGAFKRTYAMLKQLGFDYESSLRLIQQGAYLMDVSAAPSIISAAIAQQGMTQRQKDKIVVKDIGTLLQKYGSTVITAADGKSYLLVDCSGLQRPRKTYSYSRRNRSMDYKYRGGGRSKGRSWKNYSKNWKRQTSKFTPSFGQYFIRKPFVTQGNVSTYNGFTSFRGSNKLIKPYTTQGYVSTYSLQNFLNGSSYGMRKVYKIDMRQYKTGALSTKSSYPAAYRNIAVAYRRNMYKDLYAKYGASRMLMRANKQGYSNASIVRLRRNEIYNRERYAERRDLVSKIRSGRRKANV